MAISSLTGKDTLTLNDRVLVDFADGDVATITFSNELMTTKIGKNGNSIHSLNETGKMVNVELRIILGSEDDKFLNSLLEKMKRDAPSFSLLKGEFVKRTGDGDGNVQRIVYNLSAGVFKQGIDTKENIEGDTEQAVSIYKLDFAKATRSIE